MSRSLMMREVAPVASPLLPQPVTVRSAWAGIGRGSTGRPREGRAASRSLVWRARRADHAAAYGLLGRRVEKDRGEAARRQVWDEPCWYESVCKGENARERRDLFVLSVV